MASDWAATLATDADAGVVVGPVKLPTLAADEGCWLTPCIGSASGPLASSFEKAGVCFGCVGTSGMGMEAAVASEIAATMAEATSPFATGKPSLGFAASMCWRLASRRSTLLLSPFSSASAAGGGGRFFFSWLSLPSIAPSFVAAGAALSAAAIA